MNEDVGLLPCPFCGNDDGPSDEISLFAVAVRSYEAASGLTAYNVECGCGAKGVPSYTEADAITAWNTRFSAQPVGDDVVDLTQPLIDAVREISAQVCDRHINLSLCRKLFGEHARGAFAMASHLASDVRAETVENNRRVQLARAALAVIPRGGREVVKPDYEALGLGSLEEAEGRN